MAAVEGRSAPSFRKPDVFLTISKRSAIQSQEEVEEGDFLSPFFFSSSFSSSPSSDDCMYVCMYVCIT